MATVNVAHDRAALVGKMSRIDERSDGAWMTARIVDTTTTGADVVELVRADGLGSLSIEFVPGRPRCR